MVKWLKIMAGTVLLVSLGAPLAGAADMVSVYIRVTLLQIATPDEMRGRVSAVSSVFTGASNELGEFRAGMMAAVMVEMGFTPAEMTGIAAISSLPGVVAHVSEELQSKVRIRIVPDDIAHYSRERRHLEADLAAAGWKAPSR